MTLEFNNVFDLKKGYESGGGGSIPIIESLSITPSTSSQTITAPTGTDGYSPISVSAVSASIDANILPENIKKDVVILGTTGTFEGSSGGGGNLYNFILKSDGTIENIKKNTNVIAADATSISVDLRTAYDSDTSVILASFVNITTVTGPIKSMFSGCSNLESVDFSNLETVTGNGMLNGIFDSSGITEISFPKLKSIDRNTFLNAFAETPITSISFGALNSTSFGSYTNQFEDMLYGVTGCTVHFPSNLQSVIGSWSDVTAGFGGTNTTVLFDLPATT